MYLVIDSQLNTGPECQARLRRRLSPILLALPTVSVRFSYRSIPATLVVKSDGSLAISSDAIDTQSNPIQLVMIPNADGKTNLYMIPKEANELQTAFLVKPMNGQGWNVGKELFQSVGNTVASLNSSPTKPKETIVPALAKALKTNSLTGNANIAKKIVEKNDTMTNVSKTVTITTTDYEPPLLPNPGAPSHSLQAVSGPMPKGAFASGTTQTGPATINHSATVLSSFSAGTHIIRPLLQQRIVESKTGQTNSGTQPPQHESPGSQIRPLVLNVPINVSKLLQLRRVSEQAAAVSGAQPAQAPAISSQVPPLVGLAPAHVAKQPFNGFQQAEDGSGAQTAQHSSLGPQPVLYAAVNNSFQPHQLSTVGSQPVIYPVVKTNTGPQLLQSPIISSQQLQAYNLPQPSQPQAMGAVTQNASPFVIMDQNAAVTTSPSINSFVSLASSHSGTVSSCPQPYVVLGSHNSSNVVSLAPASSSQTLSVVQANGSQVQYKITYLNPTTSDSCGSLTNAVQITPSANARVPVIGGLQTPTSISGIGSSQSGVGPKSENAPDGDQTASAGINDVSPVFSPCVYIINGQPYLLSVKKSDGIATLVSLPSKLGSVGRANAVPTQVLANASTATVISSNTPVMSAKASTLNNSTDNICVKPSQSTINPIVLNDITLPGSTIPGLETLTVKQLMQINNILGKQGQQSDLNNLNPQVLMTQDRNINVSVPVTQNVGPPAFQQISLSEPRVPQSVLSSENESNTRSYPNTRPPELQWRNILRHNELHSSISSQKASMENNKTRCDNDIDAINVDSNSSDDNDIEVIHDIVPSQRTRPASLPIVDDDVRPMLLFRSEIARKLKPAILQEATGPYVVNKTTSITSPMVFSIPTSGTSSVGSFNSVNTGTTPTSSQVSPVIRMVLTNVNSSTVSTSAGKVSLTFGDSNGTASKSAQTYGNRFIKEPSPIKRPIDQIVTGSIKRRVPRSATSKALYYFSPQAAERNKKPVVETEPSKMVDLLTKNRGYNKLYERMENGVKIMCFEKAEGKSCETQQQPFAIDNLVNKGNTVTISSKTESKLGNVEYKGDCTDEANEPMAIKIDSVFSLNPSAQLHSNQDFNETDNEKLADSHQSDKDDQLSDASEVVVIDSPVRQNSKEANDEEDQDVIIIESNNENSAENIDSTRNDSLITAGTRRKNRTEIRLGKVRTNRSCMKYDHSCRVVLRCLNMRQFETPYSYKSLQKALTANKCSNICREMAVRNYFETGGTCSLTRLPSYPSKRYNRYIPYVKVNPKVKIPKVDPKVKQLHLQLDPTSKGKWVVSKLMPTSNNASKPQVVKVPQVNVIKVNAAEPQHTSRPVLSRLKQKIQTASSCPIISTNEKKFCIYNTKDEKLLVTDTVLEKSDTGTLVFPRISQQTSAATVETTNAPTVEEASSLNSRTAVSLSSTSEAESTTNVYKNTCTTTINSAFPVLTSSLTRPSVASSFVPVPIETRCKALTDSQEDEIKSEPVTPDTDDYKEHPHTSVSVKSEPINSGYIEEIKTTQNSGPETTRKRKSTDDESECVIVDGIQNAGKQDKKEPKRFATSESSHLEKIKRLKEQLKKEQEALEKIRKQRFSVDSSSGDSET